MPDSKGNMLEAGGNEICPPQNLSKQPNVPGIRLSLGQKIGGGYFLCLGIAVTGIIIGFSVGEYRQRQARNLQENTQQEIRLLNHLENEILRTQRRQEQLIYSLNQPVLFKQ
ncbi:MAG: hypothetical protein H0X31_07255 [Nostocaceae cyanobacterium]|nr:hypothetical protein [Nostocaceae cyanobacterium]